MRDEQHAAKMARYWKTNLRIVGGLMLIWAAVSYGASIVFVDALNTIRIPGTGFPLGFWFAQQGAIYTFIGIIGVYVFLMNRLDRQYGVDEPLPTRDDTENGSH